MFLYTSLYFIKNIFYFLLYYFFKKNKVKCHLTFLFYFTLYSLFSQIYIYKKV